MSSRIRSDFGSLADRGNEGRRPEGRPVLVLIDGSWQPALLVKWVRVDGAWFGLASWVVGDRFETSMVPADRLRKRG